MNNLLKELCILVGELGKLIDCLKSKANKEKIFNKFKALNTIVLEIANKQLDENDALYLKLIYALLVTQGVVRLFTEDKTNLDFLIIRLNHIEDSIGELFPLTVFFGAEGIEETRGKGINERTAL